MNQYKLDFLKYCNQRCQYCNYYHSDFNVTHINIKIYIPELINISTGIEEW